MCNDRNVSVATDARSHSTIEPQCVSVGLVWSVSVVRPGDQIAQAKGQAPLKHSGVFLLAQRIDRVLLSIESGTSNRADDYDTPDRMKSRRNVSRVQRGTYPSTAHMSDLKRELGRVIGAYTTRRNPASQYHCVSIGPAFVRLVRGAWYSLRESFKDGSLR